MQLKSNVRKLEIFSPSEMEYIHNASLDILENTGMAVLEDTCFKLLVNSGATVDLSNKLVKIPRQLVNEALNKTPKGGRVHYGRTLRNDFKTGEQLFFRGGTLGPHILDIETGVHRPATKKDFVNLVRLMDAMDNIHRVMFPCTPNDVPADYFSQQLAEMILENTSKPVGMVAYGRKSVRDVIKMAAAVTGGIEELTKRPLVQLLVEPVSPLTLEERQGENLLEFSRHKLPLELASMPTMCSTAPATLAGTLAQVNAEHLCMVVIAQLVNPGTPMSLNACTGCMDPRSGVNSYGAVERILLNAAAVQLWNSFYGVETYASAGLTDSKVPDQQAGYERMMNILLPALTGAHMITTLGYLESYLTISMEQIVIDNEIASLIQRILRGIELSDETLALDVIGKVGPGNHFLTEKHTLKHVNELLIPRLANRSTRAEWKRSGEKDIARMAREEAKRILETHQPEPLDKTIREELNRIAIGN